MRFARDNFPLMKNTLQFFEYKHLQPHLREVSMPFAQLALKMEQMLPSNEQREAMMAKLLEAKDCAVRAFIFNADANPDFSKMPQN